ncbi:oligosaccharide flippase family protein [Aquirufa nivalisilvae]|uniref:lipopolysaccharide biosynthesis protein n=1 Tax=Aquirufa nivalisilvae TaxID=2516557 RepID=UPI0022A9BAA7|nr:oligosaccharide flippase family protein [Aquirufa nivalisilvae]MCZ2483590.1 oligosaccharide flippase family protein [Aquirufa nivalisilvae]
MSILKKLAGETLSYGFSTILGRSLNFLLVFVHTWAFLPAELGINVKLYGYMAIANIVYTYGMETAYFRFAKEAPQKYYNLILSAIIVTSGLFTLILFLFSDPLMAQLGYAGKGVFLKWLALILAIDAITAIPFARLRLEQKIKKFVLAKIISILINVSLNLIFLVGLKPLHDGVWGVSWPHFLRDLYDPSIGAGYIFMANLIANASLFYWLGTEFRAYRWEWDWKEFKSLWIYSYPIMFMSLAAMFNVMFDRLLLEEYLPEGFYPGQTSQDALGIYGNCYKLSVFMSLAIQAFKYSAEPFFLGKKNNANNKENLALVTHWFVIVCTLLWVGVSSNLFWIQQLFLKKAIYWEGIGVVPILLLANLFLGIYYTQSVWFKQTNKTYMGTIITLVGLAVTILGNIYWIPTFGYMACAWAFLLSSVIMTLMCYVGGQIFDPTPYRWKEALIYIGMGALAIYSGNYLGQIPIPMFFTQNAGLLVILAFLLGKEFQWKGWKPQIKNR